MHEQFPPWLKQRLIFKPNKDAEAAAPPQLDHIEFGLPCEDCGKDLDEKRVVLHKYTGGKKAKWVHKCQSCKKCYNMSTGKWDQNMSRATQNSKGHELHKDK